MNATITKRLMKITGILLIGGMIAGCSGSEDQASEDEEQSSQEQELTDFEMEHGIGPVTEAIEIDEVDPERANLGGEIFEMKCASCHKMDDRFVGPPLGGVANSRSPSFIMNMVLNPDEMIEKHPIVQNLVQEYLTPMPNQNVSEEEARAVVEYLIQESQQ